jgi:GT2 family glycosyltransferase
MGEDKLPTVGIVVLNWNNFPDTLRCLDSLLLMNYEHFSIWVVDNHSENDSVSQIHRAHAASPPLRPISVISLEKNLGYAAGNNNGIQAALEAGAQYIWILNNDTWVAPDSLTILVDFMRGHFEVAICGTSLLEAERPDIIQTLGGKLSFVGTSNNLLPGRVWSSVPTKTVWPDYVVGASLLLRADFARQCGGFDSRYFLYCEDVDLSLQAQKLGFRVAVVPQARVWHKGGGSTLQHKPVMIYYEVRNRCLVARKYRTVGWIFVWLFAYLRAWQRRLSQRSDPEDFHYRMRALSDARKKKYGPFSTLSEIRRGG